MRRTKILASIGPASESPEVIEQLLNEGMNIVRFNFSHDTQESHLARINKVREVANRVGKEVQILCDLQGPKIRIRNFEPNPRVVEDQEKITLTTSEDKDVKENELIIEDPYLNTDVKKDDIILIDDGLIELRVENVDGYKINCVVVHGGEIYPRKGVNLPLTQTTTSAITDKDINDLDFILKECNPDWIALSFVQSEKDIEQLRGLIKERNGSSEIKIMAKIETAQSIKNANLNGIIQAVDGVIVARGDLGVEIPFEKLPIIQKEIIKKSNYANKPVITATQMLSSMVHSPVPTRAEVSDIANAVIDGSDAVWLSNETTVGEYPVLALRAMAKVVDETENYLFRRENLLN
jgi:pyruvate kinase